MPDVILFSLGSYRRYGRTTSAIAIPTEKFSKIKVNKTAKETTAMSTSATCGQLKEAAYQG